MAKLWGVQGKDHLEISNPVAPEFANLRISLVPGLLQNLQVNTTEFHKPTSKATGLFEVGRVYIPSKNSRVPGVQEERRLAAVFFGKQETIIDQLCQSAQVMIDGSARVEHEALTDAHELRIGGNLVGIAGYMNPKLMDDLKYRLPVAVIELDLDLVILHAELPASPTQTLKEIRATEQQVQAYQEFSRYPGVFRDISMLVSPEITVERAQEIIERIGGELVVNSDLFDEYEPVDRDEKGLAFHVEYQAFDRTLSDQEVDTIYERITEALIREIKATIR